MSSQGISWDYVDNQPVSILWSNQIDEEKTIFCGEQDNSGFAAQLDDKGVEEWRLFPCKCSDSKIVYVGESEGKYLLYIYDNGAVYKGIKGADSYTRPEQIQLQSGEQIYWVEEVQDYVVMMSKIRVGDNDMLTTYFYDRDNGELISTHPNLIEGRIQNCISVESFSGDIIVMVSARYKLTVLYFNSFGDLIEVKTDRNDVPSAVINDVIKTVNNEYVLVGNKYVGVVERTPIVLWMAPNLTVRRRMEFPAKNHQEGYQIYRIMEKVVQANDGSLFILGGDSQHKVADVDNIIVITKLSPREEIEWEYEIDRHHGSFHAVNISTNENAIRITGTTSPRRPYRRIYIAALDLLKTQTTRVHKTKLKLYPNPTEDIVSLRTDDSVTNERYIILDDNGRVVQEGRTNGEIDISELIKGSYVIKLESEELGQRVIKI